ncbi:MAG: metallophosphoesterase family protein [Bacteroidia bacterium]
MSLEKIIIFSDVHGHIYALEELFKKEKADLFVCLGDVVNYAPYSNECIELLKTKQVKCIRGNHEDIFIDKKKLDNCPPLVRLFYEQTYPGFNQNLLSYIAQWPEEIVMDDWRFVHTLENKYIYPETAIEVQGKSFIGHSHVQYAKLHENNWIINPGSLGQNRMNLNIIQYAVLFTKTGTVKFQSRYLNIEPLVRDMKALGYSDELINYYTKARE